jgi:hypothetical protein
VFSQVWQRRSVLILFVLYFVDSVWKMAHWGKFTGVVHDAGWWGIPSFALALTIRFGVMALCLWLYLRLRRATEKSQ